MNIKIIHFFKKNGLLFAAWFLLVVLRKSFAQCRDGWPTWAKQARCLPDAQA
jgi:hypothetical protein